MSTGAEVTLLRLPIKTERLILRDFTATDFQAIHSFAADPAVVEHMFYEARTARDTRDYLDRMLASQREVPRTTWELAVLEASSLRLIGSCDLTLDENGDGDLGYVLARSAWGLGYASEAARQMVELGFRELKLERIYASCRDRNVSSLRVMEKAGLRFECAQHDSRLTKGEWWTLHVYSRTRQSWLLEAG